MFYDDQLLALTHGFEDRARHYGAVTPPVYMNSLHLFPTFEEYHEADPSREDCYIYGRVANPTTHLLEKSLPRWKMAARRRCSRPVWRRRRRP